MEKIGLIAGNRRFPIVCAQGARDRNYSLVAVAIKGDTSLSLKNFVDKIYWVALSDFNRIFRIFKQEGIKKVIMAGQISPRRLFSKEVQNSSQLQMILGSIRDKKADTIFSAVASLLQEEGLELIDSTLFIRHLMPQKGVLTKRPPTPEEWLDVYFGFETAKAIAGLDIGQTVAVKAKAVVAVEALEGTDNLIRRASRIGRKGIVVVKVSKPKQDLRFDVPVIGLNTVKNLVKNHVAALAIEAGKTLFIDQEESLRLADSKGVALVAV